MGQLADSARNKANMYLCFPAFFKFSAISMYYFCNHRTHAKMLFQIKMKCSLVCGVVCFGKPGMVIAHSR